MTEQTLKHANEVLKKIRSERNYKKFLVEMIEDTGTATDKVSFKISASIIGSNYHGEVFISHEVAEMALNKEIEGSAQRIAYLEAELEKLH